MNKGHKLGKGQTCELNEIKAKGNIAYQFCKLDNKFLTMILCICVKKSLDHTNHQLVIILNKANNQITGHHCGAGR